MVTLVPFEVTPLSFHELIVQPMFGDTLGADGGNLTSPSTEDGDWNLVDNERSRVPVIDLFGKANLMKRRDSTCKLIYSTVGRLGARYIEDQPLYFAVEDCQAEFYQGAFRDFRKQDFDVFGQHMMPIVENAVKTDIYTNKYFGDESRAADPSGQISWNRYNGIWTQYLKYVTQGLIAAPIAIAGGTITPSAANTLLDTMYASQDGIMENWDDADKCFYVNKDIYDAYGDYLLTVNSGALSLADIQAGRAVLYKKGIQIKWKKWNNVLKALNGGTKAHAAILTLRGNFLFKTNSKHGGGPELNQAVRVWWSDDEGVWKTVIEMTGGTEISAPQHSVLAITAF